jgi:pilus assembly protein Flp/PilA
VEGAIFMTRSVEKFIATETGATAIEYALIASLIAVAIIGTVSALGSTITNVFNEVGNNLK